MLSSCNLKVVGTVGRVVLPDTNEYDSERCRRSVECDFLVFDSCFYGRKTGDRVYCTELVIRRFDSSGIRD